MSLVVSFLLRGESMQQAISRAIAGTHAALEATPTTASKNST